MALTIQNDLILAKLERIAECLERIEVRLDSITEPAFGPDGKRRVVMIEDEP